MKKSREGYNINRDYWDELLGDEFLFLVNLLLVS